MFTDPALARSGLSEREAQLRGTPVHVVKRATSAVLRTEVTDATQGFMAALVSANEDSIFGFTMSGAEAGKVVAAVQTARLADPPDPKLQEASFEHPMGAEG